jgi:hypothetical protein
MRKPLSAEAKSRQIAMLRAKYDWQKSAQETVEVYNKVVGI